MKNHAQAILQFTGYPLEPIVALEVNKSLQSKLNVASRNLSASPYDASTRVNDMITDSKNWDPEWFSNYE